ncbi:hypothetical protein D3C72_1903370 [compost metagenome]
MKIGGIQRDPGVFQPLHARLDTRPQSQMELDIRRARVRVRIPETARFKQRGGNRAGAKQNIFKPRPYRPVKLGDAVIGMVAGALGNHEKIEMILKVRTDAGQVMEYLHAHGFQMIRRAYARLQ